MNKIKVMDENLANKISAGEVIEKLASIVKELVENSIDAGSSEIKVELLDSGLKEIKVIDNGIGMNSIDAKTAFLRHATSKIYKEDDLFFLGTLGFRGEALASIASVSEVILKTFDGKESSLVHIKGGKLIDTGKCPERKGTEISVSNVFYNTPARLKYLKSSSTELFNITSFIEKLALSNPNICFSLKNNDKEIIKTSGSGNLEKTIYEIYGFEIANNMMSFKNANDDFEIYGYCCKPHLLKSNRNFLITFLNGRVVRNAEINSAINDGYYTYKPDDKYPIVILNIETDPTIVDVNIHPTKQDVKISKSNELCNLITTTIKNTLYDNLLVIKPLENNEVKEKLNVEKDSETFDEIKGTQTFMDFEKKEVIKNEEIKSLKLYGVGLAHGTYIIAENEDGVYLLDQHAAYERINYERYMQKLREKTISKISLLIPMTIELSPSDYIKLMEKKEIVKNIGIDMEEFGINTVIIKAHPSFLKEGYEEEQVRRILEIIINIEKDFDRVKFEEKIAITLACKMSIKANMHISEEEIQYILDELVKCDNPYNCPHGRPTIIKFSIYDLEKMFKRVMD